MRLALALAVLLLVAPAAPAKGPSRVAVCGADGCTDVSNQVTHAILQGGLPAERPTVAEPSLILHVHFYKGHAQVETLENRWLPGSGLIRGDDGHWMHPGADQRRELERVSRGVRPLPAVAMSRAELAPRATTPSREETGDGGGGAGTALAVAAPAAAALGLAAMLARRRRRRR